MELIFADNSFASTFTVKIPASLSITLLSSTEKQTYLIDKEGLVFWISKAYPTINQISFNYNVTHLSCGREHIALITELMTVYTWGSGESGALGLGSTMAQSEPQKVNISSDHKVTQVSCGAWHTMIIARYQSFKNFLLAFGRNNEGQLGTGKLSRELLPCKVTIPEEIIKISCGTNHTLILGESSSVYSTGDNRFGQLGLGHKRNCVSFTRIELAGVDDIDCGRHSAALSGSNIFVWGTGTFGELLVPTLIPGPRAAKVIKVGDCVGSVLDANNKIWAWGLKNTEKSAVPLDIPVTCMSMNSGNNVFLTKYYETTEIKSHSAKNSLNGTPNCLFQSPRLSTTRKNYYFSGEKSEKILESQENESPNMKFRLKQWESAYKHELQQKNHSENQSLLAEKQKECEKLHQDLETVLQNNQNLEKIIEKLSYENQKLVQSYQPESEIKDYYESLLESKENEKKANEDKLYNEILVLHAENDRIQEMLVSLRQENTLIEEQRISSNNMVKSLQSKTTQYEEIIDQLGVKIETLQKQLSDMTSANHNLYKTAEKSQKNQIFEIENDGKLEESDLEYKELLNINRKGLSLTQKEKLIKAAAENMKYDEPVTELRSVSPLSISDSARKNKKSFEDIRNNVKILKNNRNAIQSHMQEFEKRFKK